MSNINNNIKLTFRKQFSMVNNPKVNWFPGHMAKIYKDLPNQLKKIDILLEVRDSRIPITSGNPELLKYLHKSNKNIKRIILFNKYDLCNKEKTNNIINNNFVKCNLKNTKDKSTKVIDTEVIILSAKTQSNVKKMLENISKSKKEFNTIGTWGLICGIPNVGKSSLINSLRSIGNSLTNNKSTNIAKKGDLPTTTKHIDYFRVYDKPNIFILDSPGIVPPKLNRYNLDSFKLSACRNIKDIIVEKEWVSDYVLFKLNEAQQFKYVKCFNLKEPTDNISKFIEEIKKNFKKQSNNDVYDLFIKKFNEGLLGEITLDEDEIKELDYNKLLEYDNKQIDKN